jgi:flagellar L-ring protein precursor FlgH
VRTMCCVLLCLVVSLFGCAHTKQTVVEVPNDSARDPNGGSGAIYQQGMGDYYLDHKARNVGDIVTVRIIEEASASQEATTETGRQSDLDAALEDVFGLPDDYGMSNFLGSGQSFSPTFKGNYNRDFQGGGSTVRRDKLALTVTASIVEKLPGGNLRIEAKRQIKVNREKQDVTLAGIIRPEDISAYNTILSTQIAEAQIHFTGKGVLGDTQGPNWFARIMDWLWPL